MSKEKQIEIPESEMGMSGYSKFAWKLWDNGICDMEKAQRADQIMREQGYRKASEVAEEIFAEIEEGIKAAVSALQFNNNPIHRQVKHETYSSLMRFVKTIEKKYTEKEKRNEKQID